MDKKFIEERILKVEENQRELMDLYTEVRETDAETIKRGRLKSIQIQIGKGHNYLLDLKKQLSEIEGD